MKTVKEIIYDTIWQHLDPESDVPAFMLADRVLNELKDAGWVVVPSASQGNS